MSSGSRYPSLSVVVTVLNEEDTIIALLKSLTHQTVLPAEIIVVDGGSQDQTETLIQHFSKTSSVTIREYHQPGNRSVGRNTGIRAASHELVAITDAGCVPHPDWLEQLLAAWMGAVAQGTNTQLVVVAGYYDAHPRTAFEEAVVPYALVMPDRVNPATFLPATRSMLLPKTAWQQAGAFDEKLADNEDFAFAQILKTQTRIVFAPQAQVTWQSRSSLRSFWTMIFRFARGDIQAGIIRPKVLLVFARYLGALAMVGVLLWWRAYAWLGWSVVLGFIGYSGWAIGKNRRYVSRGWYWLPVLQWTADIGVMLGSVAGWTRHRA